jgi:hypothetical protein
VATVNIIALKKPKRRGKETPEGLTGLSRLTQTGLIA